MDIASTHMAEEVEAAIHSTGAILIYGPPYSPHLNRIEQYFAMYEAYLKQKEIIILSNWHTVQLE